MQGGGWRVEGGGCRVEGGRWKMKGGGWRVEGGGWRAEGGGWRVEAPRAPKRDLFLTNKGSFRQDGTKRSRYEETRRETLVLIRTAAESSIVTWIVVKMLSLS